MNIINLSPSSSMGSYIRLFKSMLHEIRLWNKYEYGCNKNKKIRKLETYLTIISHALEKGMSVGNVRDGFGQEKALSILTDLETYISIGGKPEFVDEVCGIIKKYMDFNNFTESKNDVEAKYLQFYEKYYPTPSKGVGVTNLTKKKVVNSLNADFRLFSQTRFSIRDYGYEQIDENKIYDALKLCQKTPSACNRQSWRVYVIKDKAKRDKVLTIQGVKGFLDGIQLAIMVCGEIGCYNIDETNLLYTDGGLYCMNLLYALHYEGMATIPLSVSYNIKRVQAMKDVLDIPDNEAPVLLIGVGSYKDECRVAISKRNYFKNYIKIV